MTASSPCDQRGVATWRRPKAFEATEGELELDDELCLCFHISRRKVLNYLRLRNPRVPSQLSQCGGAGTGCGWCIPFLRKMFQQHQSEGDSAESLETLTSDDYAKQRGAYIRSGKGTPPPGATPPPADSE